MTKHGGMKYLSDYFKMARQLLHFKGLNIILCLHLTNIMEKKK